MLCLLSLSFAQITRTSATFPVAWDEYYTATDTSTAITITAAGPDQTWDFSALQAHTTATTSIDAASFGEDYAMFPTADVLLPLLGGTAYAEVNTNSVDVIGISGVGAGGGGGGFGFPDVFEVNPAFEVQHAPLDYGNTYTNTVSIGVPIALEDIPQLDTLINDQNPIPGSEIDSMRINISIIRDEEVDAWGSLTTPTGTYDVLRMKQIDYTDTGIEIYVVSLFGNYWLDASAFIPAGTFPIGLDTTETHQYLDEVSKAPIVQYTFLMGLNGPITYQTGQVLSNKNIDDFNSLVINAYPNPAINFINLEVSGLEAGDYHINLYNIVGSQIKQEVHYLDDSETIRLDLDALIAGTYLFNIQNEEGRILRTQRIIVRKP